MSKVCDIQQTITSRQLINTVEPDSLLRIFFVDFVIKKEIACRCYFHHHKALFWSTLHHRVLSFYDWVRTKYQCILGPYHLVRSELDSMLVSLILRTNRIVVMNRSLQKTRFESKNGFSIVSLHIVLISF
jgi:hypothetical protein